MILRISIYNTAKLVQKNDIDVKQSLCQCNFTQSMTFEVFMKRICHIYLLFFDNIKNIGNIIWFDCYVLPRAVICCSNIFLKLLCIQ